MRTSALTVALLAVATLATTVIANDDLSALLADLSFGDPPAVHEPLTVAQQETIAELRPVPTGITMPGMVESAPSTNQTPLAQDAPAFATDQAVEEAAPEASAAELKVAPPQVALKDPVPLTTAEPADEVDFDSAFALQNVPTISPRVPAKTVSHCLGGSCQSDCDMGVTCRPRTCPNLPSSTLLQYFRSNACYTNVWDGYSRPCCGHKHLHGECDCFKKRGYGCGRCSKDCNGCEACDGSCSH